jgi:hypothetical protein
MWEYTFLHAHAVVCQVFDLQRWEEHRSVERYPRYMDRLFTSRIAKGLQGPISYVASLCISVGTYHTLVDQKFVQEMLPNVSCRCNHHSQVQGCAGVVDAVYVYSCGGGAVLGRAAGSVM